MREIKGLFLASPFVLSNCSSVSEYVNTTGMDKNRTWGTEAEMFVLAHKLNTNIYCWHEASRTWNRHGPDHIDTSLTPLPNSNRSMYIYFCVNHFQVVSSIMRIDLMCAVNVLVGVPKVGSLNKAAYRSSCARITKHIQ